MADQPSNERYVVIYSEKPELDKTVVMAAVIDTVLADQVTKYVSQRIGEAYKRVRAAEGDEPTN